MDCISYDGRESKYIDDGRRRRERTWTTNNFNEIIRVTYYCTVVWWFSCGCLPIGFIGIITPHFARFLVGVDHRWRVPYSGLLGAILLILADIAARYVIMPQEVPVGVMTAFIGAPFFIYIARKRGLSK